MSDNLLGLSIHVNGLLAIIKVVCKISPRGMDECWLIAQPMNATLHMGHLENIKFKGGI